MGVNITTIDYLRVLIIEIGQNHYLNGGGSPGWGYNPTYRGPIPPFYN